MSLGLAQLDEWHVLNHTLVATTIGWEEQCEENNNQEKKTSYALGLDTLNLVLWGHIPFNYHDSSTNKK
jgi:hypothetical protein